MIGAVVGVVDATHPNASNYVMTWQTSRNGRLSAIEAINRTGPCTIAILMRAGGTQDINQGCCLATGTPLGQGFPLCFVPAGGLDITTQDEIAVIFQQATVGDNVALKVVFR